MEIENGHITETNPDVALLFSYLKGRTTEKEKIRVEDWMRASDENWKMALQVARIFYASRTKERMLRRDSLGAYKKVRKSIEGRKMKRTLYRISFVAACFIGLLGMSTAIFFWSKSSSLQNLQKVTVSANRGVRTCFNLPDGSVVYLNSGSTLTYPLSNDDTERKVQLSGEAYFSVKSDPERPFIVSMSDDRVRVKVLGTEFNVRAYEKDNVIQTTLVTGAVNLEMKDIEGNVNERTLCPSEKAIYDLTNKTLEVLKVDVESEIAWKDGRLVFKETPLPEVLKRLANFYNVEFKIMNAELETYRFTGTFNNRQLPQVLDYLRISSQIDYSIKQMNKDDSLSEQREQVEICKMKR